MKKVISVLLALCMALSVVSAGFVFASAEEEPWYIIENSDVTWSYKPPVYETDEEGKEILDENENPIIKEVGTLIFSGLGAIPDYAYTEKDGKIVSSAPWSDRDFAAVIFDEGITAIGNYAFSYCPSLENISVPETIAVIGTGAFRGCSALKSVELLTEADISEEMFADCPALTDISFVKNGKTIGKSAFSNCTGLNEIVLPDGIETVSEDAFANCTGLENVVLPDSVKNIEQYAFYSCEKLKTVDLGNGVEEIGNGAFSSCSSLESLAFPESLKSISSSAFYGCTALASVVLSDGITQIGESAFNLCTALKGIEISYNVTEIGSKAFGYGKRGAKIADFEITGFTGTAAEKYAADNGFKFVSVGSYLDGSCGETAVWSFDAETGTLTISGTGAMNSYTEEILPEYSRFADKITKIEIGEEITSIGAYAFYNMSVSGMLVPETVTEIGEKAIGNFTDGEIAEGFCIEGFKGSAAEAYAEENGIGFTDITPVPTEGKCGEDVTWSFDEETGTLTLSGTGATYDYTLDSLPEYADCGFEIKNIIVGEGITKIGDYALVLANAPEAITLTKDIEALGTAPFGFIIAEGEEGDTVSKIEGFTVNGFNETPAKSFAEENEFTFVSLDEPDTPDVPDTPDTPDTPDEPEVPETPVEIIEKSFKAKAYENGMIYLYQTGLSGAELKEKLTEAGYDDVAVSSDIIGTGTTLEIGSGEETLTYTFIIPGDTNGDGTVNSSDALDILNHSVEAVLLKENALTAGDTNADGAVNSTDALNVLQISVGQIELTSLLIAEQE